MMGVDDKFVRHATVDEQISECGLDVGAICKAIAEFKN